MTLASLERLRRDLVGLVHRGKGVHDFSLSAARILAQAVPFDGVCMVTMDPATMLPTGEVMENGLPESATPRMTEIEIEGKDLNTFVALRRSGELAASLSGVTSGDLDRSTRHRELRRPHGFGDELRVTLVDDSATWGGLTLLRASDSPSFSPADAGLVATLSRHLAEGMRRAMLLNALAVEHHDDAAGLVLLAPDNTITRADPTARTWLADLSADAPSQALPAVVRAVASRARGTDDGTEDRDIETVARARVRTRSGDWLLVRGSMLGEGDEAETAVILERARPHELAPLIADAHGLTDRERVVTQLVALGFPTRAIAARLHISPWTVQDHLKSIFEKVGAGSRGELVARVFFEHYAPRLTDRTPIGSEGWFAPRTATEDGRDTP